MGERQALVEFLVERMHKGVANWLGHSTAVAKKHYLQITEDHWEKAAEPPVSKEVTETNGAIAGATISARLESSNGTKSGKPQKTKPSVLVASTEDSSELGLISPGGFEPPTFGFGEYPSGNENRDIP